MDADSPQSFRLRHRRPQLLGYPDHAMSPIGNPRKSVRYVFHSLGLERNQRVLVERVPGSNPQPGIQSLSPQYLASRSNPGALRIGVHAGKLRLPGQTQQALAKGVAEVLVSMDRNRFSR